MNDISTPILIKNIKPINKISDDVFICCSSYEKRCLGTINKITKSYATKISILVNYSGLDNKLRTININKIKKRLNKISKLHEFIINPSKPIFQITNIVKYILDSCSRENKINITIDISNFMKWHLLILLKFFHEVDLLKNIRFLYTEPKDYITDLFQPLSFGIKEIFPIPFYYGKYDFSKDTLLIIFLGYEGYRSLSMLDHVDPEVCLLLIPKPAYWTEWEGKTEYLNTNIINALGKEQIRYIDSRNPLEVKNKLYTILNNNEYKKYNKIISPLGTKPQTLGLFYYLESYKPKDTILMYASPLRYNDMFYSKGIGRTWILPF